MMKKTFIFNYIFRYAWGRPKPSCIMQREFGAH